MPRKNKNKQADVPNLFEEDDFAGANSLDIKVNKSWAKSYEDRKRKQDLAQARERGLFDAFRKSEAVDSEDDESEDDGAALTTTMERKILDTIHAIRSKDPRIYNKDAAFFAAEAEKATDGEGAGQPAKPKGKKAADVIREQLIAAAEEGRSDAFDEDDVTTLNKRAVDEGDRRVGHRVYDAEQAELRKAFLQTVDEQGDLLQPKGKGQAQALPQASDDEDDDGLLTVKRRAEGEEDDDMDEASVASADRDRIRELLRTRDGRVAEHGHELADPDAFLDAFVSSRAWKSGEISEDDEDDDDLPGAAHDDEGGSLADSEDEAAIDKADNFEAAYNFRFEDPNGAAIVTHARNVEDTLRRKDNKRKDARERKKERKAAERREAEEETRRLMNLKRTEMKSQLGVVKDVAGNGVDMARLSALLGDELDKDWDPEAYDKAMATLFGDEYYGDEETEADPSAANGAATEAEEDEEAAEGATGSDAGSISSKDRKKKSKTPSWVFGDGPRPKWAGPSAEQLAMSTDDGFGGIVGNDASMYDDGGAEDDEDGTAGDNDDEDAEDRDGEDEDGYDAPVHGRTRRKDSKRKKASKKRMGFLARVKAMLSADAKAVREGGALSSAGVRADDPDDVLALGFEDVIAGGLKTRFKYTQVQPDDYGLSDEEILLADDADLNQYVSLKKLAPYRDKAWVVPSKKKKRDLATIRSKVLSTVEDLGLDKANIAGGKAAKANGSAAAASSGAAESGSTNSEGREDRPSKKDKERKREREEQQDEEPYAAQEDAAAAADQDADMQEGTAAATGVAASADEAGGRDGKRKRRRRHKKSKGGQGEGAGDAADGDAGSADEDMGQGGDRDDAGSAGGAAEADGPASVPVWGNAGPSDAEAQQPKKDKHSHDKKEHKHKHKNRHGHDHGSSSKPGCGHQHGHGSSQGQGGHGKANGDKLVKLPTGATLKKSRLASYGL